MLSVRYLCNQLNWEEYADDIYVTYRNLTLEFLSSLDYEPYVDNGDAMGYINFRLFGTEYVFNLKQFGNLLGFQTGHDVIPELQLSYYMNKDIDKFWSDITNGGSLDPFV